MSQNEVLDARREAREDATVFVAVALALLVVLALLSLRGDWELLGIGGWVWLMLCIPEVILLVALYMAPENADSPQLRTRLEALIAFVVIGNFGNLVLLLAALLTEKSSELSATQLLASGAVVWLTNVIVFGLWYWVYDAGGPVHRAIKGRKATTPPWPRPAGTRASRITCTSP
jgi:small-conductance mechanosensitive channel